MFFRRIKQTFKYGSWSKLLSLFFIVAGIYLLFRNEATYIKSSQIVSFAKKNVVQIQDKDFSNNKKLVLYTSDITFDGTTKDEFIKVSVPMLRRKVEMFQWYCQKSRSNIMCKQSWYDTPQENYEGYKNPPFPYESKRIYAHNVRLGQFVLSDGIMDKIAINEPLTTLPQSSNKYKKHGQYLYSNNTNIESPNIGDVRISYYYLPVYSKISVIAQQNGHYLEPYKITHGAVAMAEAGEQPAATLINNYKRTSQDACIALRLFGFLLLIVGVYYAKNFTLSLLSLTKLSFLIDKMNLGTSIIVAGGISLLTIAVAWIFYNLAIGLAILFIIGVLAAFSVTAIQGFSIKNSIKKGEKYE